MEFRALRKEDMPEILKWRSQCPEALRTSFNLTLEQQERWYYDVVCNRQSNARWWGIELNDCLVGYCAIENISWENRNGEISLLLSSDFQGKGLGEEAFKLLMDKAFCFLNLENAFGECYEANQAVYFWSNMIQKYNGVRTTLPNRKYYSGRYWDSLYFNFNKGDFYS